MEKRSTALVLGGIALAILAANGFGSRPRPEDSQLCREMLGAVDQMAREYPNDFPEAEARENTLRACKQSLRYPMPGTPVVLPSPVPDAPSPGCKADQNVPPPGPRTADVPARDIPYFAPRTGELPPDGPATVGGVKLPAGSRCLGYWSTDKAVANAKELAGRLAAAHADTGLWPVLWTTTFDDADGYAMGVGNPSDADGLDVERILRRTGPDLRGLAPGSGGTGPDAPFASVSAPDFGYVLLLVPANRPADVLSVLGGLIATEVDVATPSSPPWRGRGRSASARSWSGSGQACSTWPSDRRRMSVDQARMLATEHNAFTPDEAMSDERGLADAILRGDQRDIVRPSSGVATDPAGHRFFTARSPPGNSLHGPRGQAPSRSAKRNPEGVGTCRRMAPRRFCQDGSS